MKTKDKMVGTGIGLAALAAAGAYFLYGKRGTASRRTVEGWALQMKGEILEKMEKLKDINQQAYNDLVDDTAERYGRVKKVGSSELKHITADLKSAWAHISRELKQEAR
jgi:gas vesicle protein